MGEAIVEPMSKEQRGIGRASIPMTWWLQKAAFLGFALFAVGSEVGARALPIPSSGADTPTFPGIQCSRSDSGVKLVVRNADPALLCRYLQAVHNLNALPVKGVSGVMQGEVDAVNLERAVETLLKANGYRGQWIGKILLIGAESKPDEGQTSFRQNGVHILQGQGTSGSSAQEMASPVSNPPFLPMEPSPVVVPEATANPPQDGSQGETATSTTSGSGDPSQSEQSPQPVPPTPSGNPMDMSPGSNQGENPSPTLSVAVPPQPENATGPVAGSPVE